MIDFNYLKIYQIVFRKIVKNFYAGIGYHLDYHYNIKEVDPPDSLKRNDLQKYGFSNKTISSGLSYNLLYDSRKNIINPKSGAYFNFQYYQNYTFLCSD